MLVSVLTTSKDRREFLRAAMESVLAQDYSSIEHIVKDAGSQDGTRELLKDMEAAYKKKGYVLKWISRPDKGQAEAMNEAAHMATGELVCLLNDDDMLEHGAVKKFADVFTADPSVDFVYGDNYKLEAATGKRDLVTYRLYSLADMTRRGYQIPQCASMFRRTLFDTAGYFDLSLKHVAEHDLFMRFTEQGAHLFYMPVPFETIVEHAGRGTYAFFLRGIRETKRVNFQHGGGYFSRFYVLYLRDRYFSRFFSWMKGKIPWLYGGIKRAFNKVT